jgi:integrase
MSEGARTRKPNLESWIADEPDAEGYYRAAVWMGTKANGRPDRRYVKRKNLASVRKRVKELERARDAGKVNRPGRVPTVEEMLERHLGVVLAGRDRSPNTIRSYRSLLRNHVYPRWGGQRADRLLTEQIEDGLAEMRASLAPASRRKLLAVVSSVYELMIEQERLVRNPCRPIIAPEAPESELQGLTRKEAQRVVVAAAGRPNAPRWALGLGLGLRQGEALGLRWEYLNLDTGEMRIFWQLNRLQWEHGCAAAQVAEIEDAKERDARRPEIEHACAVTRCKKKPCPKKCRRHKRACPPPCPRGCRGHAANCPHRKDGGLVLRPIKEKRHKTVWLDEDFCAFLRAHRDAQFLKRVEVDAEWEANDLVFCQWNGRPIDPKADWAEWSTILELAGLPHSRVHAMRHTAASIALDDGIGIRVVQTMLGHSDIRVTERYTHVGQAASLNASQRMGRMLGLPSAEKSSMSDPRT